jgi:hypothetical protein
MNCANEAVVLHLHVVRVTLAISVGKIYTTATCTEIQRMPERAADECTFSGSGGKQILLGERGGRQRRNGSNTLAALEVRGR